MSELATGRRLPRAGELTQIVQACRRPAVLRELEGLLRRAEDEEFAATAGRSQHDFQLTRHAVATGERLPIVEEFRDWERLGVHRPIRHLSSGQDLTKRVIAGELPTYVEREKDRTELRPALAAASAGDDPLVRLVLVTGASLAGKTRAAVEAMRAELPTWRLLIPRSASSLAKLLDAEFDLRRTVVWLNEIQQLLGRDTGVEQLERLLDLEVGPTVLLATLRADAEDALRDTAGGQLLRRVASVIMLERRPRRREEFDRELERARAIDDPWLAEALNKIGGRYGIAEWLAAGPQLADQLTRARASDDLVKQTGAALVDAAIGCYRAGYTQPIPEPLLLEAHQLYLPIHLQHAARPVAAEAMEWATTPVSGASPLLEHHRGWGDRAFDYLLATAPGSPAGMSESVVPEGLWRLLRTNVTPDTYEGIARAAYRAGQTALAGALLLGTPSRVRATFYFKMGDVDALTELANLGHNEAKSNLARLRANRGDISALAARADTGDRDAVRALANLLADRGDRDALTARADTGDRHAAKALANLLVRRGDIDALTARADAGDDHAAFALDDLFFDRSDVDAVTARADAGDHSAAWTLANLLADGGDVDALTARAARADLGGYHAAFALANLLARRGDIDALTARADAGGHHAHHATWALANLLADRGDIDALTARAAAGDDHARWALAKLLARRGNVDALTARADAGHDQEAWALAGYLADRGNTDALTARADAGDHPAAWVLAGLLVRRGDIDALTARADNGDPDALRKLAEWLTWQPGREADVETRYREAAACGNPDALCELADWLKGQPGREADVEAVYREAAAAGDRSALRDLADWLKGQPGREADVEAAYREAAAAGDRSALRDLAGWLRWQPGREADVEAVFREAATAGAADALRSQS